MATVELEFNAETHLDELSLSGAAAHGGCLFVAPDEGTSIVRLQHGDGSEDYDAAAAFDVAKLVPVPGQVGDEIDLEGMDIADGYLWVVGSHSPVRTRVKKSTPSDDVPRLLAQMTYPPARRLLARVPLADSSDGPEPVASTNGPNGQHVPAASVPDDDNGMRAMLLTDTHLGPFVNLPGKDNGLDIEGLAVIGSRVLLGLRGPVLRGWAVILEIMPSRSNADPTKFQLAPIPGSDGRTKYVKHFLDLQGLGIRDLARHGDDLLILAGPTMALDGPSRVLRLPGGAKDPLDAAVTNKQLEQIGADLPVGAGRDHPEAITVVRYGNDQQLLVLYDSPSEQRRTDKGVRADLFPLDRR
jgi:hypothetical protein